MTSKKAPIAGKNRLSHWLLYEHELTGVMFHDADDVISRALHCYVLVLHVLLAFSFTLILFALFTTQCQVLDICREACHDLTGGECVAMQNATYVLNFADNSTKLPLTRNALWRFPDANDYRFTYCKFQGMQNDFVCINQCATPDSLFALNAELASTLPFVSALPKLASIAWSPAELCTAGSNSSSSGGVQQQRRDLLCAFDSTTACGNYLEEPGYWTTKVLMTVFSIALFSFGKPFLRLSQRVDRCAVWRMAGGVMCALLVVPVIAALIIAGYVGAVFVGNNATVWRQLFVTLGLTYGVGHLLIISPIKIAIVWWCTMKCCPPKEEDFIEMFE